MGILLLLNFWVHCFSGPDHAGRLPIDLKTIQAKKQSFNKMFMSIVYLGVIKIINHNQ